MGKIIVIFFSLGFLLTFNVQARDTPHHFPVKNVIEMGIAQGKLSNDILFFFGDQAPPAIEKTFSQGVVTNKKTNASGKSELEACNWVMLSALIQLQERARNEGGDAIVNIESYFKKKVYRSNWLELRSKATLSS